MNSNQLCGRLTRDPEIRRSQNEKQTAIASFTLAIDRPFKNEGAEQTADFIPCRAFGKTAEFIEKYFRKGSKIITEGRLQSGNYTNKEGKKVYTLDVIVERVEFAESKSAASGGQTSAPVNEQGFVDVGDQIDEELPFA